MKTKCLLNASRVQSDDIRMSRLRKDYSLTLAPSFLMTATAHESSAHCEPPQLTDHPALPLDDVKKE